MSTRVNAQPLEYTRVPLEYIMAIHQDHFKVPTVSQSVSFAHSFLPRLLHGPDGFTVAALCTYTDLYSRWYFDV